MIATGSVNVFSPFPTRGLWIFAERFGGCVRGQTMGELCVALPWRKTSGHSLGALKCGHLGPNTNRMANSRRPKFPQHGVACSPAPVCTSTPKVSHFWAPKDKLEKQIATTCPHVQRAGLQYRKVYRKNSLFKVFGQFPVDFPATKPF